MPDLTLHLFCDSSSARQLATRRGCGKIRHLQWLQDKFAAAVFQLHPLPTKEILNDLMTKSLRATAGDSNFGDQILLAWEPVLAQTRPRILHVTSCSGCLPPHRSARAASQAASAYEHRPWEELTSRTSNLKAYTAKGTLSEPSWVIYWLDPPRAPGCYLHQLPKVWDDLGCRDKGYMQQC